jgi:threonine dehydratase
MCPAMPAPAAALPADAPGLPELQRARRVIQGRVRETPLVRSPSLSRRSGAQVHLKLETHQETGSFKLRGAFNRLLRLDVEQRRRGVVTVSTGNHGRAVAHAARALGIRATVCCPAPVPRHKLAAIEALGAALRVAGQSQDDAQAEAERLAREEGRVLVPPFDDADVIAGQGTIGLELAEALPALDTVLVPLSGGGLIAGVALALKALLPAVRVVGVSMERGAAMVASLRAGRPVAVEERPSLADALGGGIGLDNRYTFPLVRALVDECVLLSEAEIAAGMRHLFHAERIVAEGAGAVGVAALLAGKAGPLGATVAAVVSGGNVETRAFQALMAQPAR